MSRHLKFDATALSGVLSGKVPAVLDRAARVRLLAEVFQALLDGRLPSRAAALFVAGGGLAWLENGGDLLRAYWKVAAPRASHHTPTRLWLAHRDERKAEDWSFIDMRQSKSPMGEHAFAILAVPVDLPIARRGGTYRSAR